VSVQLYGFTVEKQVLRISVTASSSVCFVTRFSSWQPWRPRPGVGKSAVARTAAACLDSTIDSTAVKLYGVRQYGTQGAQQPESWLQGGLGMGATVFVRNLPRTVDHKGLEQAFTHIGPVRSAFIVNGKDNKPRGIGFVEFAIEQDAQNALATMQDRSIGGRNIKLELAVAKGQRKKPPSRSSSGTSRLPQSQHVATGVAAKETAARGAPPPPEAPQRHQASAAGEDVAAAAKRKSAKRLAMRRARKAAKLRKANRKGAEPVAAAAAATGAALNEEEARQRSSHPTAGTALAAVGRQGTADLTGKEGRLIVRNLSFKCSEEELRQLFETNGSVTDVRIPLDASGRPRGFGFVQFEDVAIATEVVKSSESMSIRGRPVAVDFAIPQSKYKQLQQESAGLQGDAMSQQPPQQLPSTPLAQASDARSDEAAIQDELHLSEEESSDESTEGGDDGGQVSAGPTEGTDSSGSKEAEEQQGCSSDSEQATATAGDSHRDQSIQQRDRQQRSAASVASTVFLRNVLFETTEQSLRQAFSRFGSVRSVNLVVDPHTQRPRGTAFVEFTDEEAAARSIEEGSKGGSFHESKMLEQSTVVSAAIRQGGIVVDGRRLLVTAAVSRDEAMKLRTTDPKLKGKSDRRNLYLAAEGTIREGDPAAAGLTRGELALRANAEYVKAQKLKDPSNFVSQTRLCVRNLPLLCDERQLKAIFLRALEEARLAGRRQRQGKRITQVKVVRDTATGRTIGGAARSRGYGFVEFAEHDDALLALRALNNNPTAFQAPERAQAMKSGSSANDNGADDGDDSARLPTARSTHRLVVEFAVESTKALQKLGRRKQQVATARDPSQPLELQSTPGGAELEPSTGRKRKKRAKKDPSSGGSHQNEDRAAGAEATVRVAHKRKLDKPPHTDRTSMSKREATTRGDDILAASEPQGGKVQKRRRRGIERRSEQVEEHSLQDLIASYKKKYF
jgi:nucleolar protein 4